MSRRYLFLIPIAVVAFVAGLAPARAQDTTGLTQYSIGDPSGDETEILETINRSRANPAVEGQRLVDLIDAYNPGGNSGIDLTQLLADFQGYPSRPPLAFNADLNISSAGHLSDMITTGVESHTGSNGSTFQSREIAAGYRTPGGENVALNINLYVLTPRQTEADYEIDAGTPDLGHRLNIMEWIDIGYTEIGIADRALGGCDCMDFGENVTPPLLTGAVFHDNLGTGFYASGEGVSGVTVTAPGFSSYYAVTGDGGAYTLPLDLAGSVYAMGAPYTYDTGTGQFIYSPFNPAPVVNLAFTDSQGNVSTLAVTLTHTETVLPGVADPSTGFTGVEPAVFDASGTPRWDCAEADLVLPAVAGFTPPPTPGAYPFFNGQFALGNGVYYLAFSNGNHFGYYSYLADPNYIFHFDLGYEYAFDANDGQSGVYLYDFKSNGFFYTSPNFPFPYLFSFAMNSVVYYYPDPNNAGHYNTDGVRYFYVFNTGQIVEK